MMRVLFDQGTIVVVGPPDTDLEFLPGAKWDPRVGVFRAPAYFYPEIVGALAEQQLQFIDEAKPESAQSGAWQNIELRPYQAAAVLSWELAERRGIVALPTGSGKTRIALAAMAKTRASTLCLVPTRALLRQWLDELRRHYTDPVGCLGDGERTISNVCVATFESAYRLMPQIGRRFDLLIVDEVHHFGAGARDETLEMCIAAARLGLTATPPTLPAARRLEHLIGPIVSQLGLSDLSGKWLAEFDRVVLHLPLDAVERTQYRADRRAFRDVYTPFSRAHPDASFAEFTRVAGASAEGRAALAAWRRTRSLLALTRSKRLALHELLARHRDNRVLVFTSNNETAYTIAKEQLIMPITCHVSRTERETALQAFCSGELRRLVSSRVLNEGIDVPDADVAIIVGGTHGEREYVQRIGRLLRPRAGKRALVYELITSGTSEVRQASNRSHQLARVSTVPQYG